MEEPLVQRELAAEPISTGNRTYVEAAAKGKAFQDSKEFEKYAEEGAENITLQIQINTTKETLHKALANFKPKPFSVLREKKQKKTTGIQTWRRGAMVG